MDRQGNIGSIVAIGQRINPETDKRQVVYLEEGVKKEGLSHITDQHRAHFKQVGIGTRSDITKAVMTALIHGKVVGIQGMNLAIGKTGRPIYEFDFKGRKHLLAVQLKPDNSVLGANPKEDGVSYQEKRNWEQFRKR